MQNNSGTVWPYSQNIRLGWKRLASDKHSSLLKTLVKYVSKTFYNIRPTGLNYKHSYVPGVMNYDPKVNFMLTC